MSVICQFVLRFISYLCCSVLHLTRPFPKTTLPSIHCSWLPARFGQWETLIGSWRVGKKNASLILSNSCLSSISARCCVSSMASFPVKNHFILWLLLQLCSFHRISDSHHNGWSLRSGHNLSSPYLFSVWSCGSFLLLIISGCLPVPSLAF